MAKKSKYFVAFLIILSIMTGAIAFQKQSTVAKQQQTLDEVFSLVGPFIKDHPEYLSQSIQSLNTDNIKPDLVVATVNKTPITIGELELRNGMANKIGSQKKQETFEELIEEKTILSYAKSNSILPTDKQLQDFLDNEKKLYQSDEEFKNGVNLFCEHLGMSVDEYWNTYETYNAYRILIIGNVEEKLYAEGEQKGHLKKQEAGKGITPEMTAERVDYVKNYISKQKKEAKIVINQDLNSYGLVIPQ